MGGGFTLCAALPLPVQSCPHRGSRQEIQGREAAQTGTGRACRSSSRKQDTRLADWLGAQTAVFRSGETRPEAESKRALLSDKPGALPPETGFPLNNVRGQADPYTQHKRDGVPPWKETKAVAKLVTPDPLEAEDRPGRKSRRTLR